MKGAMNEKRATPTRFDNMNVAFGRGSNHCLLLGRVCFRMNENFEVKL